MAPAARIRGRVSSVCRIPQVTASDIQQIIDDVAGALQRSVVVDDPDIRLLHTSAHYGDEDPARVKAVLQRDAGAAVIEHVLSHGVQSWQVPGTVPGRPDLGLRARFCVPLRWRSELVGFLMVVVGEEGVSPAEELLLTTAARDIASLLSGAPDSDHGDRLVAGLLHPNELRRAQAVEAVPADLRRSSVVVVDLMVEADIAEVDRCRRPLLPAVVQWSEAVGPRIRTVLVAPTPNALRSVRDALRQLGPRVRSGIGTVVDGVDRAFVSARQAELARERGQAEPVFWEDLGIDALLLAWAEEGTVDLLPPEVRRLQAVDPDGQLAATVLAYLDHAGVGPATAAALHIHRTTLYYRLGRLADLTGLDLSDGRTRLALHAGLLARRLLV